jgi:hypothetical protein
MEHRLKTVAAFMTPEGAEVARLALEDAGIESFLEGAAAVGALWYAGNALGGVKVQVAEADVPRAREILANEEFLSAEGRTCRHCGAYLPAGFNICWSCQAPVQDSEQAKPPEERAAVPPAVESAEEDVEPTSVGDATAWRALLAAILGIFLCPPLLNVYSLWILFKLGFQDPMLSRKGSRHYYIAMGVDLVVCCLVGWFVRALWQG